MNVDDCQAYIANLFSDLRSLAARARAKRVAAPQDIGAFARETELVAILDMMRRHAALFDIELEAVGMANFDPFVDELDPTKNPVRKPHR
jgi:hypothetical protein